MCNFMAASAQERSFSSKIAFFPFFGHLKYKYKKITEVQSCTKFNLKTFLLLSKNILLHKNLSKGIILQKC